MFTKTLFDIWGWKKVILISAANLGIGALIFFIDWRPDFDIRTSLDFTVLLWKALSPSKRSRLHFTARDLTSAKIKIQVRVDEN